MEIEMFEIGCQTILQGNDSLLVMVFVSVAWVDGVGSTMTS